MSYVCFSAIISPLSSIIKTLCLFAKCLFI
nr:MAG TPA: hypothetical protein [Caudoviricetes sp.]DAS19624.1 MAG TPA: hypothetical protein [Caudoviricetes sp.]